MISRSKTLMALSNILLLTCGCTLIVGCLVILYHPGQMLLSKLLSKGDLTELQQPLLYYVANLFLLLGILLTCSAMIGCWASCTSSFYLLTLYFMLIFVMLVGECVVYVIVWMWPQCFGLGLSPNELVKIMQKKYGVAGQEQFTAAIDLAQSSFSCCGIVSSIDYESSLWRLESLGPQIHVPLTCCKLDNYNQLASYLDPKPINASLCQAIEPKKQEGFRHIQGCANALENWFREQYIIFLSVGFVTVLAESIVILTTLLACMKVYKQKYDDQVLDTN